MAELSNQSMYMLPGRHTMQKNQFSTAGLTPSVTPVLGHRSLSSVLWVLESLGTPALHNLLRLSLLYLFRRVPQSAQAVTANTTAWGA